MRIQCPYCGLEGEVNVEVCDGQKLMCPSCQQEFLYVANVAVQSSVVPAAHHAVNIRSNDRKIGVQLRHSSKVACPRCGCLLQIKTVVCPQCGCYVKKLFESKKWSKIDSHHPEADNMAGAIIAMLLFLPFGIVALLKVFEAKELYRSGDVYGSEDAAKTASDFIRYSLIAFACMFGIFVAINMIDGYRAYVARREVERGVEQMFRLINRQYY